MVLDGGLIKKLFADLPKPPQELHFEGDIALLEKPLVCVVGSRRASSYSKQTVFRLCSTLKSAGAVVVSGAAMGIDAAAHEGAFPSTVAVVANGLDILYPPVNRALLQKIYQNALAISEYAQGVSATKYSFVIRNRLMVAMSKAVVIAEAEHDSGSMRTAEFAIKLKKPLFVLPHRMGESGGTNELLKRGLARAIYDFSDFLEQIGLENAPRMDTSDELLLFCRNGVGYEELCERFGDRVFEYELQGLLRIENSTVWSVR